MTTPSSLVSNVSPELSRRAVKVARRLRAGVPDMAQRFAGIRVRLGTFDSQRRTAQSSLGGDRRVHSGTDVARKLPCC